MARKSGRDVFLPDDDKVREKGYSFKTKQELQGRGFISTPRTGSGDIYFSDVDSDDEIKRTTKDPRGIFRRTSSLERTRVKKLIRHGYMCRHYPADAWGTWQDRSHVHEPGQTSRFISPLDDPMAQAFRKDMSKHMKDFGITKDLESTKNSKDRATQTTSGAAFLPVSIDSDTFYSTLHIECQRRTDDIYFDLINKYSVPEFIKVCGRNSEPVKQFFKWLCDNTTKEKLTDAKNVWVGYEPKKAFMPVLVAEVKGKTQTDDSLFNEFQIRKRQCDSLFNKFRILMRSEGQVSNEARSVAGKELSQGLEFTASEQIEIHKCLSKHTDNLMTKHSNLLIVSASKIKSKNFGNIYDIKTCIVFYVHIKGVIPFNEDAFPTELDGFPVDVREGTFKTFSKGRDFHERLLMGCQIVTAYNIMCSLGGFVELNGENIGCLTCGHAFETETSVADFHKDPVNQSYVQKEVYQPQPFPHFEFGKLVKSIRDPGVSGNIGVDVAVIEITKPHRYPCTGAFPDAVSHIAGFSEEKPMVFNTGKIIERFEDIPIPCTVVKYGSSTGHTVGQLRLAGPAVYEYSSSFYSNDRLKLHKQLEVFSIKNQVFADEGDSGALVFLVTKTGKDMDVRALGLLVGGTDYGTTIVTPIWAVLNKLNLPLKLLSFETPFGLAEDPANQRLEKLETDVDHLKQTADATRQTISSLENKIDITDRKQGERSTSIETKVSSLETQLDVADKKQGERSASIESKVSSLENKIENKLEAHHSDLSSKMDRLLNIVANN